MRCAHPADDRPAGDGRGPAARTSRTGRSSGPSARPSAALPDDVLADRLGSGDVRGRPPAARPRRPRLEPSGAWTGDRSVTAPERRQARTLEGILGVLGPPGRAQPGPARHRGPPPGRRRDAGRSSRSWPGSRGTSGWRSSARSSRTSSGATTRGWRTSPRSRPARGRPTRLDLLPLDRDELAALIEGIQGERASASLLLLVAERSGGLPLVAEELLAARRELPSSSLTGSFDELVIARMADPLGRNAGAWPG